LQIYHFTCKGCGYDLTIPLGNSDLDQVLTDANVDYADYRLFRCDKESKFVHADIHGNDFESKCAIDGSKMEEIDQEMLPIQCPRCNRDLIIQTSALLANVDSASAL
jgi:hypothetical protein